MYMYIGYSIHVHTCTYMYMPVGVFLVCYGLVCGSIVHTVWLVLSVPSDTPSSIVSSCVMEVIRV